jgi:hypothetical protein
MINSMKTVSVMPNNSIARVAIATGAVLLVPLIAMQITSEVNWTLFDFVIAGTLLCITGLMYEFVVRRLANRQRRIIAAVLLALGFLYLWSELAVGIFTNWGS